MTRRSFLSASAAAMASVSFGATHVHAAGADQPVSATSEAQGGDVLVPASPGPKIGVAVVGLGKFAVGQILPAFAHSHGARPTALVSGDAQKAKAVAAHYGIDPKNLYSYHNYDALVDNPSVDAVFIVLPNALHAEYSVRAAQAGKHVLCEKPMATTVEDCERMIEASRAAKRKLMIAYRVRHEPYNQTMIAWSREKKYGPVQLIVSDTVMDVGGAQQWRLDPALSGGGSLVDIGIYSLNATRYLTGEEPIEINAMQHSNSGDPRFAKVEESILFQLRFPSGAMANCSSSYGVSTVNRYRVIGTKGWYGLDPATSYTDLQLYHSADGKGVQQLRLPQVNHVAAEMDHLAKCIRDNVTPLTPGEEGLRDVRLMQAIYRAAAGRETVRLI